MAVEASTTLLESLRQREDLLPQDIRDKHNSFDAGKEMLANLGIFTAMQRAHRDVVIRLDNEAWLYVSKRIVLKRKPGSELEIDHGSPIASVSLVWRVKGVTHQLKIYSRHGAIEVFGNDGIREYSVAEYEDQEKDIFAQAGLNITNS